MTLYDRSRQRDLYLIDPTTCRIIYIPQNWANDMRGDDPDDGPCIVCWYGNPACLAFQLTTSHEWLTTDAQAWFRVADLDPLPEVSEAEARSIDPDLFTLLDSINNGTAK